MKTLKLQAKNLHWKSIPYMKSIWNGWVIIPTPLASTTRAVWQQCVGDYSNPTCYRYKSSVVAMRGWLFSPHLLSLQEQCGCNVWVIIPTPPATVTTAVWLQCVGDYSHPTCYRYKSSVVATRGWLFSPHLLPLLAQCGSIPPFSCS